MMPLLHFILLYSIEKGTFSASVSAESTKAVNNKVGTKYPELLERGVRGHILNVDDSK